MPNLQEIHLEIMNLRFFDSDTPCFSVIIVSLDFSNMEAVDFEEIKYLFPNIQQLTITNAEKTEYSFWYDLFFWESSLEILRIKIPAKILKEFIFDFLTYFPGSN